MRTLSIGIALALLVPVALATQAPLTLADILRSHVRQAAVDHGLDPAPFLAELGPRIDELAGGVGPTTRAVSGGPSATVGDVFHVYVNSRSGSALGYAIHTSTLPATPPVVLPPPATFLAYDVGGPIVNVKGSYLAGFHTAGTVFGSNADTNGNLPVVNSALVNDRAIDFVGHALVSQGQFCLFGLCIATGGLLGDGAMVWDNSGPAGIPNVP